MALMPKKQIVLLSIYFPACASENLVYIDFIHDTCLLRFNLSEQCYDFCC